MNPANGKIARKTRDDLVRLFPRCFMPRGKPKQPLAYNLVDDIAWRLPELERRKITLAIIDYCRGETYLACLIFGAPRLDLDGNERGCVNPREADRTAASLAAMRANNAHQTRRAAHANSTMEQHP